MVSASLIPSERCGAQAVPRFTQYAANKYRREKALNIVFVATSRVDDPVFVKLPIDEAYDQVLPPYSARRLRLFASMDSKKPVPAM